MRWRTPATNYGDDCGETLTAGKDRHFDAE